MEHTMEQQQPYFFVCLGANINIQTISFFFWQTYCKVLFVVVVVVPGDGMRIYL
jgi:hypothetical protein